MVGSTVNEPARCFSGEDCSHCDNDALQEEVLAVGRVCCDSEGRLNECSVLLEGSMELSGGQRVRLDLSKLQNFRVFPGQASEPPALPHYVRSGSACVPARVKLQGCRVFQDRCSATCTARLPASGCVYCDLPNAAGPPALH